MRRGREKDLQATVERLGRRVDELERELRTRPPALPAGDPGWQADDADELDPGSPVAHEWLAVLEPPVRRRPRVPRLPFEILFLAGCAVAVGIADLEPLWIVVVMAAAWALVALLEWSATLADRRRDEQLALPPPRLVPVRSGAPDQAWYVPPVEQTMVEGAFADSATAVTRLGAPGALDLEATMERRAADTQA